MRRVADAQVTACPFCQSESFADGICRAGCSPKEIETAQKFYALPVAGVEPKHLASTEAPDISWDVTNDYTDLLKVLRHEAHATAAFGGKLRWNEMKLYREAGGQKIEDAQISAAMEVLRLRFRNSKGGPVKFTFPDLERASLQLAKESPFHPVADWLNALPEWDSVPRIQELPTTVLPLHQDCRALAPRILRKWFVSAVARALRPGCAVHTMLILTGAQGIFKSTFFKTIAGEEWFSDTVIDINDPARAAQTLQGAWIHELAELETMLRSRRAETWKAWLTSASDNVHLPYAHENSLIKRTSVCVGTTNPTEILDDSTGERRYWPLRVTGDINLKALEAQRTQLWAEAKSLLGVEDWWFPKTDQQQLAALTDSHKRRDAWTEDIEAWLGETVHVVTVANVLAEALKKPVGQWTRADEMRVAAILRGLGFERRRVRQGERVYWEWSKDGLTPAQRGLFP